MPELQPLRADHAPAILDFEITNRAYFAASVGDRGDEFFERFAQRHNARLAEQESGEGAYYVLVAEDGSVLGRFNLVFVGDGYTAAQIGTYAAHVNAIWPVVLGPSRSRSRIARRLASASAGHTSRSVDLMGIGRFFAGRLNM